MLVLIGAKENHGPFGQNSMVPNGPWRYGLSLARGVAGPSRSRGGGTGAQPSPAAFQLGLLISSGAGRARPGPHRSCGLKLG